MSYRRNGLKVLGLSLVAVLGLMAFLAAGAQASEKSWLVEAKDITANQTVTAKAHTEGVLTVKEETNLEILCSVLEAEKLELVTGTTEAKGKVKFSKCKTWQNSKDISVNCTPLEPIIAGGKAKLILHEKKNYVLFEPEVAGGNFTVIKFDPPCALPESNNVKGSLVAECGKLVEAKFTSVDCAVEEKVHLLQPNEALFLEDKLLYGAKKAATLKGIASVELATGKTWCGHV